VYYVFTQVGALVSLIFLPAATLSLLFNFSPIIVAVYSSVLSHEPPSILQWGGIVLSVIGAAVYFLPLHIPLEQRLGLTVALICILANAGASLLGRRINHQGDLRPILVTSVSMGIGGLLVLIVGVVTQGFGQLDLPQWLLIGTLAVVNTALAFTIGNHTLRTLTAVESSIINNTMLPQIAILAWVFLEEPLRPQHILGIVFVGVGTLIVQLWRSLSSAVQSMVVKPE
jgi:drug/metabolite transporter (DMT)-like permease